MARAKKEKVVEDALKQEMAQAEVEREEAEKQEVKRAISSLIPKLTDEDCIEAMGRCRKYHEKMQGLENRLKENEAYYRQQYTYYKNLDEQRSLPEKGSGYLLNAVINKVADMMDNYPQPTILPREESDEETASILSKVIPAILERNNYTKVYYKCAM